jgi:lipoic acid synthetase
LIRDRRSGYGLSLDALAVIRERSPRILAKSGFMVGLGETEDEIVQTLRDLAAARADIVTIGQYLQPSRNREPVRRYYRPEEFENFKRIGLELGIPLVLSGPLVRSSYRAAESWNEIRGAPGA